MSYDHTKYSSYFLAPRIGMILTLINLPADFCLKPGMSNDVKCAKPAAADVRRLRVSSARYVAPLLPLYGHHSYDARFAFGGKAYIFVGRARHRQIGPRRNRQLKMPKC